MKTPRPTPYPARSGSAAEAETDDEGGQKLGRNADVRALTSYSIDHWTAADAHYGSRFSFHR